MNEKILVVDDEPSIVELLDFNLTKAGFQVVRAMDGEEAIRSVYVHRPTLMVLDMMLPKKDGIEVCKELRFRNENVAILMLTAKDEEFDKVLSLELGADDYMTKPFSVPELVARIRAIIRRRNTSGIKEYEHKDQLGSVEIFPEQHDAFVGKSKLELTLKEFELISYFARNKGKLVTRDQIFQDVWGYEFGVDSRNLDVHISRLREKIGRHDPDFHHIKTIRGLGYKIEM
ncbi:response regulator transcription factor [Bacillaceae bacterium S4-13-58]